MTRSPAASPGLLGHSLLRGFWVLGCVLSAAAVTAEPAAVASAPHHRMLDVPPELREPEVAVSWQVDLGGVSIFEFSGDYSREIDGTLNLSARAAVGQEFFDAHADAYDFLVVFSTFEFELGGASAFHIGVRNDVAGIGLDQFDQSSLFGSNAALRGYVDMGPLAELETDPLDPEFESTLAVLIHEIFHQWAGYVAFDDGVSTSDALRQSDGVHWSFLLDSDASVLYGNDWEDNGDGSFKARDAMRVLSPLDLYLAGLYGASEVPPFSLLESVGTDPDRLPEPNATITATARPVSIGQVVAVEGPRIPSANDSQGALRAAFLLLTPPGESASEAELLALENIRSGLASRYSALTAGRGRLEIFPERIDGGGGGPGDLGGGDLRQTPASVLDALAWLRVAQTSAGYWEDRPSTQVRDSTVAWSVLAEIDPLFTPGAAAAGLAWLAQSGPVATDFLARKSLLLPGLEGDATRAELVSRQNADGGWGADAGLESGPLDTALVLLALRSHGFADETAAAAAYLVEHQAADGGWGMTAEGGSDLAATVAVVDSLSPGSPEIVPALVWIVGKQNGDGGFGDSPSTAHGTAMALDILLDHDALELLGSNLGGAESYLLSRQEIAGSWEGSIYTTALVARTLQRLALPNWRFSGGLLADPIDPVDGETVALRVTVLNDGHAPAPATWVRFFDGDPEVGAPIGEAAVPALGPGQSTDVGFSWDTHGQAGDHALVSFLDADDLTTEVSESDNQAALSVGVAQPPTAADLAIAADAVSVTPPAPNRLPTTLSISTRVDNLGLSNAADVGFELWSGPPETGVLLDQTMASVSHRSSIVVNFSAQLTVPGTSAFSVVADATDALAEPDEENNVGTGSVTTAPSIDLEILDSDLSITDSPAYPGQDASFTVRIRNRGTVDSPLASVEYQVSDGTTTRALPAPSVLVEAGETIERALIWRVDLTGALLLSAEVDGEGVIPELDEDNNQGHLEFESVPSDQPNLAIGLGDLVVAPSPALEGSSVTLSGLVRNTGPIDLEAVEVVFFDGDPAAGGEAIGSPVVLPLVVAGGEAIAQASWSAVPDAADRVIVASVDPSNLIEELDEADNSTFVQLPVLSLPDLAVAPSLIEVNPPLPAPGQTAEVTVTVQNPGEQTVDAFVVRVLEGGGSTATQIDADQVVAVGGQSTAQAVFDWIVNETPVARELTVEVDPEDLVRESNEHNNRAARLVGVQIGGFVVSAPLFSPNGDGTLETTTLVFDLDTPQTVSVEVVDSVRGKVVRTYSDPELVDGTRGEIAWDGKDGRGLVVRDATYVFRVLDDRGEVLGQAQTIVDSNRNPPMTAVGTVDEDRSNLTCRPNPEHFSLPRGEEWGYFLVDSGATAEAPRGLYRSRPDGTDSARVVSEPWLTVGQSIDHFSASSDGGRVAFQVVDEGDPLDPADDSSTLWVANGDGTGLFELPTDSPELPLGDSWEIVGFSASLRTLLVEHGSHGLVEFRLDGPPIPWVRAPSWLRIGEFSPDHTYLLLDDSVRDVVQILDVDTGTAIDLYPSSGVVATWSPDGSQVAVAADRHVHVMTPDASLVQTVSLPEFVDGSRPFVASDPRGVSWAYTTSELATIVSYDDPTTFCFPQRVLFVLDLVSGEATELARSEPGLPCHLWDPTTQAAASWSEGESADYEIDQATFVYWDPTDRTLVASGVKSLALDEGDSWRPLPQLGGRTRVSPSGRYWLYESSAEAIDPVHPCFNNPGHLVDTFSLRTLENLSLHLDAVRPPHSDGIELSGTAIDKHFKTHSLAWADGTAPDIWHPIGVPSTRPVVDEFLGTWVAPYPGVFTIRMRAEDAAGTAGERIRRVVSSTSPDLTNVDVQPRLISPNGDALVDELAISYDVEHPVSVVIRVLAQTGEVVRSFERSYPSGGVSDVVVWDGRDSAGLAAQDGHYEIEVNQYRFPIEIDLTPPEVSGVATLLRPPPGFLGLPGQLLLTFRGVDANPAEFPVEGGVGEPPTDWEPVPVACAAVPFGFECSAALAPDRFVDRSFRAVVWDLAGNFSASQVEAPQGLITTHFGPHSIDSATGQLSELEPVGQAPIELEEGPVRFAVVDAVAEAVVDLVAQFRECPCPLPGEPQTPWSASLLGHVYEPDGTEPVVGYPDPDMEVVWEASELEVDVEYQVRLRAIDADLVEYHSRPISLLQKPAERLHFGSIARGTHELLPDLVATALVDAGHDLDEVAVVWGRETFLSELSNFGLVLQSEDDPDYWVPRALDFLLAVPTEGAPESSSDVYFAMPDWSGCDVYEGTLTAEGPEGEEASESNTVQLPCLDLEVEHLRARVGSCGESPATERSVLLTPRSLDSSELSVLVIEDAEHEVFRVVSPDDGTTYEWVVGTADLEEGPHAFRAVLENVEGASFEVPGGILVIADRTPPSAAITFPQANQRVCGTPGLAGLVLTVEGALVDEHGLDFRLEYGRGSSPSEWFLAEVGPSNLPPFGPPFEPLGQLEFLTDGTVERGALHLDLDGPLSSSGSIIDESGLLTSRVRAVDAGWHLACDQVTFEFDGLMTGAQLTASPQSFSPNGDTVNELTAISLTATLEPATVDLEIYPGLMTAEGPLILGPLVKTLASGLLIDGTQVFEWDGRDDAGDRVEDGGYLAVSSWSDDCGNPLVLAGGLEVDTLAPSVEVSSPTGGTPLPIVVHVFAEVLELNLQGWVLEYGVGTSPEDYVPIASGQYVPAVSPLAEWNTLGLEGAVVLRLRAFDEAGNEGADVVSLDFAERLVLVSYLEALPDPFSPNGDGRRESVAVRFGLDEASTVTLELIGSSGSRVVIDGQGREAGAHVEGWDGTDTSGESMGDDTYLVRLMAVLPADPSITQTEEVYLTLDRQAPAIELVNPPDGGYLPSSFQVFGSITDPLLASYSLRIDGVEVDAGSVERVDYDFHPLESYAEGDHQILVQAIDAAENEVSLAGSFTIDDTPPALELSMPPPNAFLAGGDGPQVVAGSVFDENLGSWILEFGQGQVPTAWTPLATSEDPVDGEIVSWDVSDLEDGSYTLRLVAVDLAANESAVSRPVSVDNTQPVVEVDSPQAGSWVIGHTEVTGSASDAHLDLYELSLAPQGTTAFAVFASGTEPVSNGLLGVLSTLPVDGNYTLRLEATDLGGNRSSTTVAIAIDTTPPLAPSGLMASRNGSRDIELDWNPNDEPDLAGYHVYRDGTRVSIAILDAPSFSDTELEEATYTYQVSSEDLAGQESELSVSVEVTIDLTPPTTLIVEPTDQERIGRVVAVDGTAHSATDFAEFRVVAVDPTGGEVLLGGSTTPVQSGLLAVWNTEGELEEAEYTLRLEADDLFGNTGVDEVTVVIDNSPPMAPTGLLASPDGNDVAVAWNANSEVDLLGYLLFRNDELVNGGGSVLDYRPYALADPLYDDLDLPDGVFEYVAYAIDAAGNLSLPSAPDSALLDNRSPRALIYAPDDGARFEAPVLVRAEADDDDIASVQFGFRAVGQMGWFDLGPPLSGRPFDVLFEPAAQLPALTFGEYEIRVVATDAAGNTDLAPETVTLEYRDLTPPGGLTGLSAWVDADEVALAWEPSEAPDLEGYHVYRAGEGLGEQLITPAPIADESFVDSELAEGTYSYRVTAVDSSANESEPTGAVSAEIYSPILELPWTPTLVNDIAISGWVAGQSVVTGEVVHEMALSLPPGTSDADGHFVISPVPLSPGSNQIVVRATDGEGNISKDALVTVVHGVAPSPPTGLAADVTGVEVALAWNPNPELDIEGYRLFRDGGPVELDRPVEGLTATASSSWQEPSNAIDGDPTTGWALGPNTGEQWLEIGFPTARQWIEIEVLWSLQQTSYSLQAWTGFEWLEVFAGEGDAVTRFRLPLGYRTDRLRIALDADTTFGATIFEVIALEEPIQSATTRVDTPPDGTFEYIVTAVNALGFESAMSSPVAVEVGDVTPPDAVMLTAIVVNGWDVELEWTQSTAPDLDHYTIYRDGLAIGSHGDLDNLQFLDPALANGSYEYVVRPVDAVGNVGDASNVVPVEVAVTGPPPPVDLVAVAAMGASAIDLEWGPPSGSSPAGYEVLRSPMTGGAYSKIASVTSLDFRDESAEYDEQYFYVVVAADLAGNKSTLSNEATAVVSIAPPVLHYPGFPGVETQLEQSPVSIFGSGDPGHEIELHLGAELVGSATSLEADRMDVAALAEAPLAALLSPDGSRLWVLTSFGGLVYHFDTHGTLTVPGDPVSVQWDRTGSHLIFVEQGNTVRRFDIASTSTTDILTLDSVVLVRTSPRGRRWVVLGAQGGSEGFYLVDDEGASWVAAISLDEVTPESVAWSPDERFVAYQRADSTRRLEMVELASGTVTAITSGVGGAPSWAPDSESLVYSAVDETGQALIWRFDLGTGAADPVTGLSGEAPAWSPDGSRIAYSSAGQVRIADLRTGMVRDLGACGGGCAPGWSRSGHLLLEAEAQMPERWGLAGHFDFPGVDLDIGPNEFASRQSQEGSTSSASESMTITLLGDLPDLSISATDLAVLPVVGQIGGQVDLFVTVRNLGVEDSAPTEVLFAIAGPEDFYLALDPLPLASMPPSSSLLVSARVELGGSPGVYTLMATADPLDTVVESDEANNVARRDFGVVALPGDSVVQVETDSDLYLADEESEIMVILVHSGDAMEAGLTIDIEDAAGSLVARVLETSLALEHGVPLGIDATWNTGSTFADEYRAVAKLATVDGEEMTSGEAEFLIAASWELAAAVSTELPSYQPSEVVDIVGYLSYGGGNTVLRSLVVEVELRDDTSTPVHSWSVPLGDLLPGTEIETPLTWDSSGASPGLYTLELRVLAEVDLLAYSETAFLLDEDGQTFGEITVEPNPVPHPEDFVAHYSIGHEGEVPLVDLPVRVRLVDPATSATLAEQEAVHTLVPGSTVDGSFDFASEELNLGEVLSLLVVELATEGGSTTELALDADLLRIVDARPPAVSVEEPQPDGFLGTDPYAVLLVTDDQSTIREVEVSVDGGDWLQASPQDPAVGLYRRDLQGLAEGDHALTARAFDAAGNSSTTDSVLFVLDSSPPEIVVTGVEDGGAYFDFVVPVVDILDAHLDTESLRLNGEDFSSGTPVSEPGGYLLEAAADDLAGNSAVARLSFVVLPAEGGLSLTVNSANDVDDGVCNQQHCSLREALRTANSDPFQSSVAFDIGSGQPAVILLLAPLPVVVTPVAIDGATQAGSSCSPRALGIEVQGGSLQGSENGLTLLADGNVVRGLTIVGFPGAGVVLAGSENRLTCLHLGVTREGLPDGNGQHGLLIEEASADNVIGNAPGSLGGVGGCEGDCNRIAFNGGHGVAVAATAGSGTSVLGNRIENNDGLAIDLGVDGPTPNDDGDGDVGPNGLQNFPEILSVQPGSVSTVRLALASEPEQNFEIELFANLEANSGSDGEPQDPPVGELSELIGRVLVTTDPQGHAEALVPVEANLTDLWIAATATHLGTGSTSEAGYASREVASPELSASKIDLLAFDADADSAPSPGDTLRYEIVISNLGDGVATEVLFEDQIPSNAVMVPGSVEASAGTIVGESPIQVSFDLLGPGASVLVSFEVVIVDPLPALVDRIVNQGTVSSEELAAVPTDDPDDPTGGMDATVTPVSARPDLAGATLSVSDVPKGNGDGQAQPGEVLSYEIQVRNAGNADAAEVRIRDLLPPALTLDVESVTVTVGGGAGGVANSSGDSTLDVSISTVPGHTGSVVVALDALLAANIPAGLEVLSDTAQVESLTIDPFDTSSADIEVVAVPLLTLAKEDGGGSVEPGAVVVYEISGTNEGTQEAVGVVIEDSVPSGSIFAAGESDSRWTCLDHDPGGTLCSLQLGALAVDEPFAVDFAVEALSPPELPEVIFNSAIVRDDGSGSGGVPVEASASDSTPVDNLAPPTVTNIDTVPGSGDGSLEECESVIAPVSGLVLSFSEAMDPVTVTDVDHWRVLDAGPDRDLTTLTCSSTLDDDVQVLVSRVTYLGSGSPAEVEFEDAVVLGDGPYRLLACAADGLTDLSGDELDGDGDLVGGDDFVRTFRVDSDDLFANGHFDCSIDGWVPVAPPGSAVAHDDLTDLDGATISGSARFTNGAANMELALGQCVAVQPGSVQELKGFAQLLTPGASIALLRACEFFEEAECIGAAFPVQAFFDPISTVGSWIYFSDQMLVPEAASSALCQAILRSAAAAPFEALLDDLSLDVISSPVLFEDGFESGDTSAWSSTVP